MSTKSKELNISNLFPALKPNAASMRSSLYSLFPQHFIIHVSRPSLGLASSRRRIVGNITSAELPWNEVQAVADDMLSRGKFKQLTSEQVQGELKVLRQLARRESSTYDVED